MRTPRYVVNVQYKEGTAFLRNSFDTQWRQNVKADAMCPDGKIRRVRLRQSPDTWFSHPGDAKIDGKSVKGFVSVKDGVLHFCLYKGSDGKVS